MQVLNNYVINNFLNNLNAAKVEVHAISIVQDGEVLLEKAYKPYKLETLHPIYSVTKSFTSQAIGFLLEENNLSLDDLVLDYFPEYKDVADESFTKVTIENLLTMSLGHDIEVDVLAYENYFESVFTKKIVNKPGETFFYNSHCSHILSAIVTKITGESLEAYLEPRLFNPLEINDYYWLKDYQGLSIGGYGLHLKISDMSKFGATLVNGGRYKGKQIIPQSWVEKARKSHISTAKEHPIFKRENRQGYGYHFWMCTRNAYRCSGFHGQVIYIQPHNKLSISMFNCTSSSQAILDCLYDALESQNKNIKPIDFEIDSIIGDKSSSILEEFVNKEFIATDNYFDMQAINFKIKDDILEVCLKRNNKNYYIKAQNNNWHKQKNDFKYFNTFFTSDLIDSEPLNEIYNFAYASYGFTSDTSLKFMIREMGHSATSFFTISLAKNKIRMDYHVEGLVAKQMAASVVFVLKS